MCSCNICAATAKAIAAGCLSVMPAMPIGQVSSLATQILELDGKGGYDYYTGGYEDYLASKGIE